jgi:hypothetical protein
MFILMGNGCYSKIGRALQQQQEPAPAGTCAQPECFCVIRTCCRHPLCWSVSSVSSTHVAGRHLTSACSLPRQQRRWHQ